MPDSGPPKVQTQATLQSQSEQLAQYVACGGSTRAATRTQEVTQDILRSLQRNRDSGMPLSPAVADFVREAGTRESVAGAMDATRRTVREYARMNPAEFSQQVMSSVRSGAIPYSEGMNMLEAHSCAVTDAARMQLALWHSQHQQRYRAAPNSPEARQGVTQPSTLRSEFDAEQELWARRMLELTNSGLFDTREAAPAPEPTPPPPPPPPVLEEATVANALFKEPGKRRILKLKLKKKSTS